MEIKDLLDKYGIIGIISTYKSSFNQTGLVKDLNINNISKALKIVGLESDILNMNIEDLTIKEKWKLELATKLNNKIIIIGNMSKCLNYKDKEYIKKLLIKLHDNFNKKIVIIDNNIKSFFDIVKRIVVLKNKKVIYESSDFYDDNLYKYTEMPEIIDFIKYVNRDKKILKETTDIYELIKDIFRSNHK